MPSAIGIRVYKISIRKDGASQPFNSDDLMEPVDEFVANFIRKHSSSTQHAELERSWYFDVKKSDGPGNFRGYVHYGTFGFESNFIDAKTKAKNYRRKTTDVEEIPLYFEFWQPTNEPFSFVVFQSFQGRSCINLVMTEMKSLFEKRNKPYSFRFKKLLPGDPSNSPYSKAPVKRFRLIKKKAPSDIADKYFKSPSKDLINFEITISARRNRSLGSLGGLFRSLKTTDSGVVTYDGVDFPEAVADVQIGNKTRKVGVFGLNSDAGVIDITNEIKRGPDGHPTFQSMAKEADSILQDMYEATRGDKD